MKYTPTELLAFDIMGKAGRVKGFYTTNECKDIHSVANEFIQIAEQIKAERAVCAMEEKV